MCAFSITRARELGYLGRIRLGCGAVVPRAVLPFGGVWGFDLSAGREGRVGIFVCVLESVLENARGWSWVVAGT
jgi:hypothetical protein